MILIVHASTIWGNLTKASRPKRPGRPRTIRPMHGPEGDRRSNATILPGRILHKLRCSPRRAGRLAKAIHVLQNYETTAG
jgi:hypothetical protein